MSLSSGALFLFIVGHISAEWLRGPGEGRRNLLLGVGLCTLGILLCTLDVQGLMARLQHVLPRPLIGRREPIAVLQQMYGALAIFFGIGCLPRVQAALATPRLRWLGKISFSLYLTHFPFLVIVASAGFVSETTSAGGGATSAPGVATAGFGSTTSGASTTTTDAIAGSA